VPAEARNSERFTRRPPGQPRAEQALAALPMTGMHAPAVAGAHPGVSNPVIAGSTGGPAARDPFMAAADPVPISADPNPAGRRRDTHHFDTRRRRRDHDDPSDIVTLI